MSTFENDLTPDSLKFQDKKPKSVFHRLSPRVFIYPVVILVICFFMAKNKALQEQAGQDGTQNPSTVVRMLDPNKPTALLPADAPVFPQLIFYHDANLPDEKVVRQLHDKYHRLCTVTAVDFTASPQLKQRFQQEKTPFAVFSKPDGTVITVHDIHTFEFFDKMLDTMLTPKTTPKEPAQPTSAPGQLN